MSLQNNWGLNALKKAIKLFSLSVLLIPLVAMANIDWVVNNTDGGVTVPAGSNIIYTVVVANNGSDPTPVTTLTLAIDSATTFVSATGLICAGTGPVNCTVPALASAGSPSDSVTVLVTVKTSSLTTPVTLGASVPTAGEVSGNAGNNIANEPTPVVAGADLELMLTGPASTQSGSTASYTFTVLNKGPSPASNFVVSTPIPTGFSGVIVPAGCSLSGSTYSCTVAGPLAVGASVPLVFSGQVAVSAGSTLTPSGSVIGDTPADPISDNNTKFINTTVTAGSDVKISKSRSPAGVLLVGDTVTFTLKPSYTGESPNTLVITDTLPINYTITTVTSPQNGWTCGVVGQTVTCTKAAGTVAGTNVSLGDITILAQAASVGAGIVNTANISVPAGLDPNPGNNSGSDTAATIQAPTVDLRANKTGPSPRLVVVGYDYSYNISASNIGTAAFFGTLVMTDSLPAGLTLNSYTLNGWSCSPAAPVAGAVIITCSRVYTEASPLAAGDSTPAVTFNTLVTSSGSINNSVTVSSPDANIAETNLGNNTVSYDVTSGTTGDSADIRLIKTVDLASVAAGDVLTYTLEIVNDNPAYANTSSNVDLTDTFQSLINNGIGATSKGYVGESIALGNATGGVCGNAADGSNARKLSCNFATIPVCTQGVNCAKVTVQVRPGGNAGNRTNSAEVISKATPDPNLINDKATVTSAIEARADVTVSKTATPASVPAGQELLYVIAATNVDNGLSSADNVTITDTLPDNLVFVSATPNSGTCGTKPLANSTTGAGNNQIVCNLGAIANRDQQTVVIVVRPKTITTGTTIINNVAVTTSTTEVNSGNNTASASTPVTPPVVKLNIDKDDTVDPLVVGDNTVYSIKVTNQGPSSAENIVVTDTLPTTKLSYVSHTVPTGGSCALVGNVLTCSVPYLAEGATISFTVTMIGVAKGIETNVATVTSSEVLAGNGTADNSGGLEVTTVRTKADMQVVSKIASAPTVNIRDNFNFVVKVRNNNLGIGWAEADDVVVSDTLPAGVQLTGTPTIAIVTGSTTLETCTGVAGGTAFTCSLGTVDSGAEVDITVPVQMVTVTSNPQNFTNTASVLTSSFDTNGGTNPTAGNNFNSGTVSVNSSSIAGRVFRDFNNNGTVDAADTGIAGVTITLTGTTFDGAVVNRTVITDASGNYTFIGVAAGVYSVTEGPVVETNLLDGIDAAGSAGGTVGDDTVTGINLAENTAATGYNFAEFPQARIGLAKSASSVTNNNDSTYSVTFTLTVNNASNWPLSDVQITDDLTGSNASGKFGTYTASAVPAAGEYTIVGAPTVFSQTNGAVLNAVLAGAFTGSDVGTGLLVQVASSLPNVVPTASSAQVRFTVRFFPITAGPFNNTAIASGLPPDGDRVTDNSVNGAIPDANGNGDPNDDESPTPVSLATQSIGVAKAVGAVVQTGLNKFRIPYSIIVANPSLAEVATNVQVTDSLIATFPTAQSITIASAAAVSACSGTVLTVATPAFTGTGQNNLLAGNQNLLVGERCTITFVTEVDFGANPLPAAVQNNQAVATTAQVPGGAAVATDLSNVGINPDPSGDDPTPVDFAPGKLSAVTGKVYLDVNHNRVDDDGAPATASVQGFIVEVLNGSGVVIGRAITDANGDYAVAGLFPSVTGNPATYYSVRFREPTSGAIYGLAQSNDPTPARNGTISNGIITSLQLASGVTTLNQDLPLDPSGVVYDAITRSPVAGATVTLLNGGVPVADNCLIGNQNAQVTGASGMYQYLLINPAPLGCPGNGVYTIAVVQPGGYLPPASTIIPPQAGNYSPTPGPGVDAIQPQPGPPTGLQLTTYFFSFNLDLNGHGVVNNHIPLDPILGGAIVITKTTPLVNVSRGDLVPYTITATNTLAATLTNIDVRDAVPPGFKYKSGTSSVDGVAKEPTVNGRDLSWTNIAFTGNQKHVIRLMLVVGSGVAEGEYVNTAFALNNLASARVSNTASATVRVVPDPTFDCSDLIGKVFDDKNANGYQDEGEPGIANVRLATLNGLLVTTDDQGRFHIACADVPNEFRGSNFVMKLDERTLPSGYRVTTENPRDVRMTRGKLNKLNFGAAIHRVFRLELTGEAFNSNEASMTTSLADAVAALPEKLRGEPSIVRLAYNANGENEKLVRSRIKQVRTTLEKLWKESGCCYALAFEEEIFERKTNKKGGVK